MDYPAKMFDSRTLDGVFLSHAHMDHSGGLPFFEHYRMGCPIFCTRVTKEITKILLRDSQKIQHMRRLCEAFNKPDMKKVLADVQLVRFDLPGHHRTVKFEFFNAGHIPGSACVKLEIEGKTLLYTGDYNTRTTALMEPARPAEWGAVDILVTEATYGAREHADRARLEAAFLNRIEKVLDRGGRVLIPVFAVGRAQEVLLMLAKRRWKAPIYIDGMAKKVTRVTMNAPSRYVRDKDVLKRMYAKMKVIDTPGKRDTAAGRPGIYVSTSGMLQGGPALTYLEHLYDDPLSAVLLTGYQVNNTTGFILDQDHEWNRHGETVPVKCDVFRYDFSAHLSRSDIQQTILATRPSILVFNHGNPAAITHMVEWARAHTTAEIFAPMVGDQIDIGERTISMHLYVDDDGYDFPHEHQHGMGCQPARDDYVVEYDE